jgi:hypothetical protein
MSNKAKKGLGKEAYFARYKANKVRDVNRTKRIEAAIKRDPNNEQLKQHLKDAGKYRSAPKTRKWNPTTIRMAELMKLFVGKWDDKLLSTDMEVWAAAKNSRNEQLFTKKPESKSKYGMFSLGVRCRMVS